MAVTGADLLYPEGPVQMVLFPNQQSNQVVASLDAIVANAYSDERVAAQTDAIRKDALARALALSKTFEQVWIRMNGEPLTVNVTDKGSHGYSREQIGNMKALSDKYLADFNTLLDIAPSKKPSQFPGSMSVQHRVVF